MSWCGSIATGVKAFHICKNTLTENEPLHRNVTEILEYVVTAIGLDICFANTICFKESIVGLCIPAHYSKEEYLEFLGPTGYRTVGIAGVLEVLRATFTTFGNEQDLQPV